MPDPAYAHYRVERTLSDVPASRRGSVLEPRPRRRRGGGRAPTERDLMGDPSVAVHDVLQILDLEGRTVWTTSFHIRSDGETAEAALLDDVLQLDVDTFRAKYGIEEPIARARKPDERSSEPGGPREGDISWGERQR